MIRIVFGLLVALVGASNSQAAIVVHTTDFIANGNRTGFNGFEGLPDSSSYGPTYTEQNIKVDQINGELNDIWTTLFVREGNRSWYPNGGDFGYTRITLDNGDDFSEVGFLTTVWGSSNKVVFNLFNDGALVLSGSAAASGVGQLSYLGFSGGGFDEIRVRDNNDGRNGLLVNDGLFNSLAVDSIEVRAAPAVPEPTTLTIWGLGGLGCAVAAYRRRKIA